MTNLETYLHQLDHTEFDFRDVTTIKSELDKLVEQLSTEGDNDAAYLAQLNSAVFSIRKSFRYTDNADDGHVRGLGWSFRGERTLEDGSTEPLFWPDVTKLSDSDFEYFEKRYKEAINLFIKTEYGLLVYFGGKTSYAKDRRFKEELAKSLCQLSTDYVRKRNNHDGYIQHALLTFELALGVAIESKLNAIIEKLILYAEGLIIESNFSQNNELQTVVSYTQLLSKYFKEAKKIVDFDRIIAVNYSLAKTSEKTDLHNSLFIADLCIKIAQQINKDRTEYLAYKAALYEKLAIESEANSGMVVLHYAEKALQLFNELKRKEDIIRLEDYYGRIREKVEMQEHYIEMPDEYTESLQKEIDKRVTESTEEDLLLYFIQTPWYRTIEKINQLAEEMRQHNVMKSLIPVKIVDKFGNTVEEYITDEERRNYDFWETYGFHFQLGSQTMHQFFIRAYEEKKLTYETVMAYLETTWLNDEFNRSYNGLNLKVKPLETIQPCLYRLFDELGRAMADGEYHYDYVTVIDSLTLKIEGILRFFCEKIGTPTFKPRQKGNQKVVMEKLLDDLLADVANQPKWKPEQITGFDEEDRIMIKYVLTEKAGLNLRNKVAHGLVDLFEYNFQLIVILFSLIMKLSKYQFVERNGDESNSK